MKDNQQLPQPSSELIGPALLKFTPDQLRILNSLVEQAASRVLAIQFNEPEQDNLRMRQHSYCYGAVDALTALLEFDKKALDEFETKMRQAVFVSATPGEYEKNNSKFSGGCVIDSFRFRMRQCLLHTRRI